MNVEPGYVLVRCEARYVNSPSVFINPVDEALCIRVEYQDERGRANRERLPQSRGTPVDKHVHPQPAATQPFDLRSVAHEAPSTVAPYRVAGTDGSFLGVVHTYHLGDDAISGLRNRRAVPPGGHDRPQLPGTISQDPVGDVLHDGLGGFGGNIPHLALTVRQRTVQAQFTSGKRCAEGHVELPLAWCGSRAT
jgi:hypothetical protein